MEGPVEVSPVGGVMFFYVSVTELRRMQNPELWDGPTERDVQRALGKYRTVTSEEEIGFAIRTGPDTKHGGTLQMRELEQFKRMKGLLDYLAMRCPHVAREDVEVIDPAANYRPVLVGWEPS
jgi:hypothetical protein